MDFSPEALREHFAKLTTKADAYHAKRATLSAELDELVKGDTKLSVKEANKREAEVRAEIKKLQAAHFPVENERAATARALGGKTGSA